MTGGASLTSESELCRGLDLPVAPGDEALVDAVVLPLEVVDLQGLLVETDPVVVGEHQPVLPPEDGGPVPLLGEALHVGGPPDVNDLLGRHQVCSTEEIKGEKRGREGGANIKLWNFTFRVDSGFQYWSFSIHLFYKL